MIVKRISSFILSAGLAVITALGCQEGQGPGSDEKETIQLPVLTSLIVSDPLAPPANLGASITSSSATGIAYVSLPPGSFPAADSITIQVRRGGTAATALIVNGGIDPVPVAADAGDTLDVVIHTAGQPVRQFISMVPLRRPPVIVRTDPPPGKRDVPLNAVMIVVFSEPVKPEILTDGSVQLLRGGGSIPGVLSFADPSNVMVVFTPAQPLGASGDYTLVMTEAIEDLSGETLEESVTVPFQTQAEPTTIAGTYERFTNSTFAGHHRYVLGTDGAFTLQYEPSAGNNFSYTGRYWVTSAGVILHFDASNTAGAWTATARLSGDSLTVAYNVVMQLADFEDGVFLRSTTAPGYGSIQLAATTTGSVPNPWGYSITLQSGSIVTSVFLPHGVPVSAAVVPGSYTVTLGDLGADCAVAGGATRQVDVVADGSVAVSFLVTCGSLAAHAIAFTRNGHLYVINPDGSGLRQLTDDPLGQDHLPEWSPDGTRIAFTRYRHDRGYWYWGEATIQVINADGTGLRQLSPVGDSIYDADPTWSPDGSRIAFHGHRDTDPQFGSEIHLMSADGTNRAPLTSYRGIAGQPAWSPDGNRIAFRGWNAAVSEFSIFVMQQDGNNPVTIVSGEAAYSPAWSADGTRLLTRSFQCLQWVDLGDGGRDCVNYEGPHLMTVGGDGSSPTRLSDHVLSGFDRYWSPAVWSPDGQFVAFTETSCSFPNECELLPKYITILRLSDGQVTRLTEGSSPSWRP